MFFYLLMIVFTKVVIVENGPLLSAPIHPEFSIVAKSNNGKKPY
jgi:hypothetical protein